MDQLGVDLHNFYRRKQGGPSGGAEGLIVIAIRNPEGLHELRLPDH
jgi:hypothetical protein